MTTILRLTVSGLALLAAGCNHQAPLAPEVRLVRTMVVDPKPIDDDRRAVGEIKPRYESDLGFRLAGKLTKRIVDVGVFVKKGDLIAQLDDEDYRNRLAAAETDIVSAKAVLVEAQNSEGRLRQLLASGTTTRANYDVAQKNLRQAEARLASAVASRKLAQDQVAYCGLRAEFDGVVTATGAEAGQIVNVGQLVVRLARPDERDAIFSLAEAAFVGRQLDGERPAVVASLLSNPEVTADGVVREIAPVADATTRTFQVRVTLKDPPEDMRFGASVLGRLKTPARTGVVLPAGALFDKGGKPAVWIVDRSSGTVALKPIVVDRYEADRVIVAGGLAKGDIVVTAGVNRLREQQTVRIAEGA